MARTADPLAPYGAKRNFESTTEPAGTRESSPLGNRFVVQKHAARRLHWDFRLEADGVLKSWAVAKGPSIDPADKRLAIRTEDHPLGYGEFEGTIPKGEYGGGTVMLWDHGTWAPVPGKSWHDIEKGHLHFLLDGERMKGEWLLIRLKPRPGEKRENWLLRKIADVDAGSSGDLVERCLTSVLTGRSMAEIAAGEPPVGKAATAKSGAAAKAGRTARSKKPRRTAGSNGSDESATSDGSRSRRVPRGSARPARKKTGTLPVFVAPQLATLVDSVPSGNQWMHEIKLDGYRALVAVAGSTVRIHTRTGLDWSGKFPMLVEAIAALDLPSALIDGEITAPGPDGNPSFAALQAVLKRGHGEQTARDRLDFHAFDLLSCEMRDLTPLPNLERKELLEALLEQAGPPIHVTDHVIGAGERLLAVLCEAGQEGIIAKRLDAPYVSTRTKSWVKVKCTRRQEFVIVGRTTSKAAGRPFGALLLAQHEDGELVYKGKVGSGFDAATLDDLESRMARSTRKTPSVAVPRAEASGARWVEPKLVAEVAFAEMTTDGRVRHGSFAGLREDKPAKDVILERPAATPDPASPVRISHRARVIFPESGRTKGDLADYYVAIATSMLPRLDDRPISLVRCPQGRARQCFFQKHDSGAFGEHVHAVPIVEKDGGVEDYLCVHDAAGILACVQMGTIEFHGWASRASAVEYPDRLVFDLDPDVGLDFGDVRKAAIDLRDRLAELGLVSFAMLSGGKGVHIIVPLDTGHGWDRHADFASRFAQALSAAEPARFVATMSKARRKGKIFIDWLRNRRGATAVVPYSARARNMAPVAAPVSWEELAETTGADRWTIADSDELVRRAKSAALKGWGIAKQALPDF